MRIGVYGCRQDGARSWPGGWGSVGWGSCLYSLGRRQAGFHISVLLPLGGSFWPLDLPCLCSGQPEGLVNYVPINDFQELAYKSPASPRTG